MVSLMENHPNGAMQNIHKNCVATHKSRIGKINDKPLAVKGDLGLNIIVMNDNGHYVTTPFRIAQF